LAFETIRSASGVDFIGTDEADVLVAFNETGAIFVNGRKADDSITFNQNISGVLSTATVYGGEGDDLIDINAEAVSGSTINGNKGEDTLEAFSLAQAFFDGGADDDDLLVVDGASSSTIRGSKGNDVLDLAGVFTSSLINGNENDDLINLGYTLGGGVNFTATISSTVVYGGADADTITAVAGTTFSNATINGNKGLDVINVNGATASGLTIFGGQGTDTITATDVITSAGAAAALYISGDLGNDSITAGAGADSIMGGDGNDTVRAGDGKDLIEGGAGDDLLEGAEGDDTILGGDGNDAINGGAGTNRLIGGNGADTFTSVVDATDTFIIEAISDSAATVTGATQGFDTFDGASIIVDVASITIADGADTLNISAVAASLAGGRIDGTTVKDGAIGVVTADTFAELKAELDASKIAQASSTTFINTYIVTVDDGDLEGTYLWINDNQKAYNQGDLMFNLANGADVKASGIIIS